MNASISHANGLRAAGVATELWTGSSRAGELARTLGVSAFEHASVAEPLSPTWTSSVWRRKRALGRVSAVLHEGARSWTWATALWPRAVHAVCFPNYRIRDRRLFRNWMPISTRHAAVLAEEKTLGALRPRIAVIPNGDVQSELRPTPARRPFREDRRFVVGALGTLESRKGQDVLIDAVALLRAQGVDAVARLGGAGASHQEVLSAKAAALGVAEHVIFEGWVDAVSFVADLDVFCLPSRSEPFGVVLLEAMNQAVPVVASDVDGPADILADGAGVLVPPGDPAALAQALAEIAADPECAAALGGAGRRRAEQNYAPSAIGASIVQAFQSFGARIAYDPIRAAPVDETKVGTSHG